MSNFSDNDRPGENNSNIDYNEHEFLHSCNICMETAAYAVISFCGHLFCWPCIYRWIAAQRHRAYCPVCNSEIGSNTLIPVRGRYNDRHLVRHKMKGIPLRRLCPSISQQRKRATRQHNGLIMSNVDVPSLSMFISGQCYHPPQALERAKPLSKALMPKQQAPPKTSTRYEETHYFPRIVAFLIIYLVMEMVCKANWENFGME